MAVRLGSDLAAAVPYYGGVPTNEDIPKSPALSPAQHQTGEKTDPAAASADSAPRSALKWRNMILAQKDHIETMRAQSNKLNASIHFVTANAYVNGASTTNIR